MQISIFNILIVYNNSYSFPGLENTYNYHKYKIHLRAKNTVCNDCQHLSYMQKQIIK